jgi:hypothetical protein
VAGGQNAILTNGETYFPPEAVEDIGVGTLRQMNNKPKEGGHAAIDKILAMTTLQGLKPMNTGGEVMPNYSGGGLTGYQNGGRTVSNVFRGIGADFDRAELDMDDDMYNMRRVLSIPAEQVGEGSGLRYYAGEATSDRLGSLRPQTFMDAAGKMNVSPQDSIPAAMIDEYLAPKKRKGLMGLLGFENGGPVEGYPEGGWEEKFKSNLENPSWEEYGMGEYATRERPGRYKDPIHKYISDMILSGRQDSLGGLIDDNYYKPLIEQELKFMNLQKRAQSAEDAIPSYSGKREGIDLGDIFGEQSWLKQRGKKKSISDYKDALGETIFGQRINELYANNLYGLDNSIRGFQDGGKIALPGIPGEHVSKKSNKGQNPMSLGLVSNWLSKAFSRDGELSPNYGEFNRLLINEPEPRDRLTPEEGVLKELLGMQNGGMIGPPVPPQMMGEQGNRELSDSIDMRQANPQMGGELGAVRQESEAIEAKIKDNIARNARLALEKIKLDNVLKTGDPDSMRTRDLAEYLKMQVMQRGVGPVREGMGDDPWRAIR